MPRLTAILSAACCLTATCATALAQANFAQSFEGVGSGDPVGGPPALTSAGWIFRNQSRPAGTGVSPYWVEFAGWGQSGSALGHGGFATWQNSSSKISAWIILPAIPNQVAGDPFKLWTSGPSNAFGENPASFEIRYSPTGGTSTGSSENDVGDFTQLLQTAAGPHAWTERTATLPGAGRIALRLVVGPVSAGNQFGGSMLIDSLQIGAAPPPPYPMPSAGQTVHWTTAHSPVTIARNGAGQNPLIPATASVTVDPGVEVRVNSGASLEIAGSLQLAGSAIAPVRLRGPGSFKVLKSATLTAAHADVQAFTDLIYGAKAAFTDSSFSDPASPTGFSYDSAGDIGHRVFDGNLDYARQVLSLTRCDFGQGCEVSILRGWVAARDCTFMRGQKVTLDPGPVGGEAMFIVGNAILDNVTVTEGFLHLMENHDQHRFIGDTSATGNPYGPGITLAGGGNYLIESSAILTDNKYAVEFGTNSAGILPGSTLPVTGNQLNEIPTGFDSAPLDERTSWADAGLPYIVEPDGTLRGQITIHPGVTVKLKPDAVFFFDTDSNGYAMPIFLGEPEKPIRFQPYTPGTRWYSLVAGGGRWFGARWDWCIFEGSRFGVGSSQFPLALDNCSFHDNIRGLYSESVVALRKCTFQDNIFSYTGERFAPLHEVRGFLDANHPANPNSFINNNGTPPEEDFFNSFLPNGGLIARARHNSLESTDSDVRNNWWGTPTGPNEYRNPGGTGDAVFFGIDAGGYLLPFLTSPPNDNPPPTVRFVTKMQDAVPGEKIVFQWTARDDGAITAQRVYYSPDSNIDDRMILLADLPAGARSFEWTVPAIGTQPNGPDQFFRVVAVDELGQEGIADLPMSILNPVPFTGTMIPDQNVIGVHRPGDSLPACASISGVVGSMYAAIELDNDETGISLGSAFQNGSTACTVLNAQLPDVSTDRARFRFDATGSLNQVKSFYGPYFSIRPDPILGDAAPTVSITSSHTSGAVAGTIVPITWTADDDEALRSFDIRASYDGGTRWFIVARDLPATDRSYNWRLAASDSGIPDVRIRVVAKDRRFQNSSSEAGPFSVAPGSFAPPCAADTNGDAVVNGADLSVLLALFGQSVTPGTSADLNADGTVNAADLSVLLAGFGCTN